MIKLLSISLLFLSACTTSIPESEMLKNISSSITDLQLYIDDDIKNKTENDVKYQDCLSENNILRKIAEDHSKKYPDNKFALWSSPDNCKKLADIEKRHNINSFFSGFYYSDLGKCVVVVPDTINYQRKAWDYCDNNYEDKDWQTCSDLFKSNIIVNENSVLLSADPITITDDLSPSMNYGSILKNVSGGRSSMRGFLEPAEHEKIRYISEATEYDVLNTSDTVIRIAAVSLSCHQKDGRLKKYRIEQLYNQCKEEVTATKYLPGIGGIGKYGTNLVPVESSIKYPATFCKCAAEKAYKYDNKSVDKIDFDLYEEKFLKQVRECLDLADR